LVSNALFRNNKGLSAAAVTPKKIMAIAAYRVSSRLTDHLICLALAGFGGLSAGQISRPVMDLRPRAYDGIFDSKCQPPMGQ